MQKKCTKWHAQNHSAHYTAGPELHRCHLQERVLDEDPHEHQQELADHREQLPVPAALAQRPGQEGPAPQGGIDPPPLDVHPNGQHRPEGDAQAVHEDEGEGDDAVERVLGPVAVDAVVRQEVPPHLPVAPVEVAALQHLRG